MRIGIFGLAALLAAQAAFADTTSYTGTLASPEDYFTVTVTMPVDGTLDLQTWGFGGGTNAASVGIPAGGFDSFVGVFAGTGPTATFIDGASDILGSYGAGCPPAGTVNIGGAVCGDITLAESLTAGTYTVLLTDANYLPYAVFGDNNGELGDLQADGFFDLTGGAFQTCNMVGDNNTCVNDTANYALDITTPKGEAPSAVPEPGGLWALGLLLFLCTQQARRRLAATIPFKI